jgi:hypothetical protein
MLMLVNASTVMTGVYMAAGWRAASHRAKACNRGDPNGE